MDRPTCETCRWWQRTHGEQSKLGECRRYAPRPALRGDGATGNVHAWWAMTRAGAGCSEHRSLETAPEQPDTAKRDRVQEQEDALVACLNRLEAWRPGSRWGCPTADDEDAAERARAALTLGWILRRTGSPVMVAAVAVWALAAVVRA